MTRLRVRGRRLPLETSDGQLANSRMDPLGRESRESEFCRIAASSSTLVCAVGIGVAVAELDVAVMSVSTASSATPDPTRQATRYSGALLAVANADGPS